MSGTYEVVRGHSFVGVLQDLGINAQEVARRKEWLEFDEQDIRRLESVNDLAHKYADEVIEDFYNHLLRFEEARPFFQEGQILDRVKRQQRAYFLRLTEGNYDMAYVQNRLNIGAVHQRSGWNGWRQ